MQAGSGVLRVARSMVGRQCRNVRNVLTGRPLNRPPLGCATLDQDDVAIARAWLRDRTAWGDPAVVERYESEFAAWNGSQYAFAFMGGRVALSAAIDALQLGAGDEVVVPGYTCVVVPNAFVFAGADVVFADIELDTYGLDAGAFERAITPRTRAVLLQHLYGLVCRDYEAILDIARRRGLRVIEDCAHSTGATFDGVRVGNRGDVAVYSSDESKVFTTVQGGLATTNDATIAEGLRRYRDRAPFPDEPWIERLLYCLILDYHQFKHPRRWWSSDLATYRYGQNRLVTTTEDECRGIRPSWYGCRMAAPVAAVGRNQLRKIDDYNARRRSTAARWDAWCDASGHRRPLVVERSVPVFLRYPVLVEPERKSDPSWAVKELGVMPGVWFKTNVHPAARPVSGCPNANLAVERCVNFPCLLV